MLVVAQASALQSFLEICDVDDDKLRERGLWRQLSVVEALRGTEVRIGGRWLVCWCTNDYLGLSTHPSVIRAAQTAARRWGVGARASRLLAGTTAIHRDLEEKLARWFGAEAALVYPSGYLANLGVLTALAGPNDTIVVDRLAHASLIDACRLSRARLRVFQHNDPDHLAHVLSRLGGSGRRVVVTEGLFSMDGDVAPLEPLRQIAEEHEALLYIDDAHGAFIVGRRGRGSPEAAGVPHDATIYMATLGKALGAQGGFVIGSQRFIDWLRNRSRPFIYATALATPVAAAASAALDVLARQPSLRRRLAEHAARLHRGLTKAGLRPRAAGTHICPVILGSSARVVAVSQRLHALGHFAPAIRPPTVPEGTARLRLSVSASHTARQIDGLIDALQETCRDA